MNVFVEEDEEATIGCSAWPVVKISGNAKVAGVEVRTGWSAEGWLGNQ